MNTGNPQARSASRGRHALFVAIAASFFLLLTASDAAAAGWTVTVKAHQIEALSNSDNWGEQDLYWRAHLKTVVGAGGAADCDTVDDHPDDDNKIKPEWGCTAIVAGGPDTTVEIKIEVYDEDTIGDDELDLSIDHKQLGLAMLFEPRTSKLTIIGDPTWAPGKCAMGRITRSGFGGGGGEPAEIIFSVTASAASAPDGDSDGDGLLDAWELCGLDSNGDSNPDVALPAMGADPARKDLFAEIDWMTALGVAGAHSHEPWLPAMIDAFNELARAPVTNPTIAGVVKPGGIAFHLDVGTLYANYTYDVDGNGTPELTVPATGNFDVDNDGTVDIGNLGTLGCPTPLQPGCPPLGGGTVGGGNALAEDPLLQPPTTVTVTPTAPNMFQPGSEYAGIKAANFALARDQVFQYVVFGHSYTQVQGGPANSSGLAETCVAPPPLGPRNPCNEVMVTLGGLGRMTVDANRDNIPDGVTIINGPAGVPVDGLIGDHVGTFLHEIGHNLSLGHGGGDSILWKPNYLSIMNYYWQFSGLSFDFTGDGLGDGVGLDLDRDSIQDVRRYQYSTVGNSAGVLPPTLNEGVAPPPFLNETVPIIPGSFAITAFTCPPVPPPAVPPPGAPNPPITVQRAILPANWDCDGNANETSVPADIDNVSFGSGGAPEILPGFDDYNAIANGGLNLNRTGISKQQQIEVDSASQRIIEPPARQEIVNRCRDLRRLGFEDLPRGTVVQSQFGPLIEFVADGLRTPTVAGSGDRNNVPTSSPDHSLINRPRGNTIAPLAFSFAEPQRVVSLKFGQAGLTSSPSERVRAVFAAFDQNDLPMGTIVKSLPLPGNGITEPLTAAAIFPDELIKRVEIRYEFGFVTGPKTVNVPIAEPVQIDDLMFCGRLDETGVKPSFPPPPKFGDLPANLRVESEALLELPGSGEPGNTVTLRLPFTGLGVNVDGAPFTTDLTVSRPEGTTIKLKAPATSGVGKFLYWRYEPGVSFGKGVTDIPLTLLRDGTVTAVYLGRRHYERPERPPIDDRERARRPEKPRTERPGVKPGKLDRR